MTENWSYKTIFDNYLGFFSGLMIVFPRAVGVSILPIIVLIIIGMRKQQLQFRYTWLTVFFVLLYAAYALSIALSSHEMMEYKYLEYKLSFVVTPLLLSFQYREGDFSLPKISMGLILGVLFTGLYGLYNAILCYGNGGTFLCFLTVYISPVHHPSYFMTYMITAMALSWIGVRRKWSGYSLYWVIPFILFGVALHTLSLSLAGILYLLIVVCAAILYFIYNKWGKIVAIGALIVLPFLAYLFVTTVPQIEGEWNGAKWYADQYIKDPQAFIKNSESPLSGSEERLIMWTVAFQEIKSHPFGVGVGNLDENLGKRLRDLNQYELATKKLNPHNQFLQTAVEIGVFGLLILLIIIGITIVVALRERNIILLLIIGCLMFNCLFESMLQRQSGIVFFTFWLCLLVIHKRISSKQIKSVNQ